MKKFITKIFIMFILLATGIGILMINTLPENSYNLAIIDKHKILASTKSPKMVLAGGSNLAFGIDSAEIQNEINIPVVNIGLHAGIGLGRILDDISPFLKTGDILLIAPEYSQFTSSWNGSEAAYYLIFDARQFRLLWSPYYGLPKNFLTYFIPRYKSINGVMIQFITRNILRWDNTDTSNPNSYTRDGFNEYGDYIKHLEMEAQPFSSGSDLGSLDRSYLKHFFQMVDYFSMRGIKVVLSYPSYEEQSFRNSTGLIEKLDTVFREKENLLVISTPISYCFPTDCFFDTIYHLNKEGRSMRTSQLIQDLQASGLFPEN